MMRRAGLVAALALLVSACAQWRAIEPAGAVPSGRLPRDVVPMHYDLELEIDPSVGHFAGRVRIDVELARAMDHVHLHAKDLEVSDAAVLLADGRRVAARFELVHDSGVARLSFSEAIAAGPATLEFAWRAPFAEGLRALYRVELGGDAYAFTQFEPIAARQVFPGFDEPSFKTTFDVAVIAPSDVEAIGNTPELERRELEDGRVRHRYARTPRLPTYLLAWAVGPLDVVDAPDIAPNAWRDRAVPLRGVTTRGRGPELAYALERVEEILASIEGYVGDGYPFAKLDIVAVPDFAAGAMENVGLVTFRDWLLLVDPENASEDQRRAYASVMAHELAHMWFGNSVTMPWWDDLWLNESFATWLAARTMGELYPEHRSRRHALRGTFGAMGADALASARRIREPILSTHDIRNAFDPITYQKGAAVIAMVEAAASAEAFRDAVRRYLAAHRMDNATGDDFLAAIERGLGAEWSEVFASFLGQAGLPLLSVTSRCDGTERTLEARQSRFRPLGSALPPAAAEPVWQIPICTTAGGGDATCFTLGEASGSTTLACGEAVHPNAGANGYYRWSLDAASLEATLGILDRLTVRERMSVANAVLGGFATGTSDAAPTFGAVGRLLGAETRDVATLTFGLVAFARERLARSDAEREAVMQWARARTSQRAREFGFDAVAGEDGEQRLAREQFVTFAVAEARDPALRDEAAERGRRYLSGEPGAPARDAAAAELLGLVARVAVRDGGEAEFAAALAHLVASDDATVRQHMLGALAFADDPARAARARELLFDDRLRTNERLAVLHAQAHRRATRDAAWAWMTENYDAIVERLSRSYAAGLADIAAGFCSEQDARKAEAFFGGGRIEALYGGPRRLAGAVERVRICAAKVERHGEAARAFFANTEALAP